MNKKILITGIIVLIIDQLTKILIDNFLEIGETIKVISNFFYLTRVSNTGAAFSVLEGRTIFLSIISIITIFILIRYMNDFKVTRLGNVAFGLLIGGIFGNFSDRLFLGYVRDFLKFNIFGYIFPVFNVADSCIVIGVIMLITCILRGDDSSGSSSKRLRRAN